MMMFDWSRNRELWIRILEKQTGQSLEAWNRRVADENPATRDSLRHWLSEEGVNGYGQSLLVMERFGYPDFMTAEGADLINRQYEDRPSLRPIYDAILEVVGTLGEFAVQARKGYVSILTPRRTFARVRATTRNRLDLALRIDEKPAGRLKVSRVHPDTPVQIGLSDLSDLDDEVRSLLLRAYQGNC